MSIITTSITTKQLRELAKERFGDLVKAVVDIDRGIMAVGGELHADEEALLLENGSEQQNLWGINFYPDITGDGFVEFDSMINIRPSQNNHSRSVEDLEIREKILAIVQHLVNE